MYLTQLVLILHNKCFLAFLKNVKELPAGHQLTIENESKINLLKWWKTIENIKDLKNEKFLIKDKFSEIFTDACKIRIRSDVPNASCLSGGIDSSSIASTISEIRKKSQNIERYSEITQNVFICEYKGDQKS